MNEKLEEAIRLAEDILKNLELSEIPLSNVVLKCARLARLLDRSKAVDFFQYEIAGYPKDDSGHVLHEAFELARYGNRTFRQKDASGVFREYMFPETVSSLEAELAGAKDQMKVAFDRDVSIHSANPQQYVMAPIGNTMERAGLRQKITETSKKIDQLKVSYYRFALEILHELKFASLAESIFGKRKIVADQILGEKVPEALPKLLSAYQNLQSKNEEDWANAVHSCRRLIKEVADKLHPPSGKMIPIPGGKTLKLDDDHYIARLKEYVKEKSSSFRFESVVGSHLDYIGDRVDALYGSANKGTHAKVTREEAESYVMYTYLLLSDVLSL